VQGWLAVDPGAIYAWCFALSLASALLPWLNCEVILLGLAALARSPLELGAIVMLTSAGQMAGKCALYWAGRGSLRFQHGRVSRTVAAWNERFERLPSGPVALVFVSSAVGIPPFYVVTVLAGALRMHFTRFMVVGTCGRLVRFGALAFVPRLVQEFRHLA
jgi:membrane protein YqaA with SNARE-associated domain